MTLLTGCAGAASAVASGPADQSKDTIQVIVKFKDRSKDPSQQAYLQELAKAIGATFVYVRPMSGDAHVLRVESDLDATRFGEILKRLAKRPEVEYAEADRRIYHRSQ